MSITFSITKKNTPMAMKYSIDYFSFCLSRIEGSVQLINVDPSGVRDDLSFPEMYGIGINAAAPLSCKIIQTLPVWLSRIKTSFLSNWLKWTSYRFDSSANSEIGKTRMSKAIVHFIPICTAYIRKRQDLRGPTRNEANYE
jgi:hypothetical protein